MYRLQFFKLNIRMNALFNQIRVHCHSIVPENLEGVDVWVI